MSTNNQTEEEKKTLEIEHVGGRLGDGGAYYVAVTGQIEGANKANLSQEDEINGASARGFVAKNGKDAYYYTGEIVELWDAGNLQVYADGSPVSSSDFESSTEVEEGGSSPVKKAQRWAKNNPKKAVAVGMVAAIAYSEQK